MSSSAAWSDDDDDDDDDDDEDDDEDEDEEDDDEGTSVNGASDETGTQYVNEQFSDVLQSGDPSVTMRISQVDRA